MRQRGRGRRPLGRVALEEALQQVPRLARQRVGRGGVEVDLLVEDGAPNVLEGGAGDRVPEGEGAWEMVLREKGKKKKKTKI